MISEKTENDITVTFLVCVLFQLTTSYKSSSVHHHQLTLRNPYLRSIISYYYMRGLVFELHLRNSFIMAIRQDPKIRSAIRLTMMVVKSITSTAPQDPNKLVESTKLNLSMSCNSFTPFAVSWIMFITSVVASQI